MMVAATATTAAMGRTTAVKSTTAAEAGISAGGKASGLPAMVVATEATRVDTTLAVRLGVPSGSLAVSVERPGASTGPVGTSAMIASTGPVKAPAVIAATAIIGVTVIEGPAMGVVAVVVIDCVMVVPIESPTIPAPSITTEEADTEADTEGEIGAAIPNAGVWIPSWPCDDGATVDYPGIVGGDVNYLGISGLNDNGGALRGYGLLRSGFEITRFFRFLAHDLNGIHDILFLVVVGVAEG